jgi:rhodanese-related sulfurtransferase
MKSLIIGSLFAAAVAAPAALACEGHHGQTAAATSVVAANTDKAAAPQKSETVKADAPAAKAAEKTFKLVSVDDVAGKLDAQKKDKKVAFAVFDANGKDTRQKEGVIPTAVLLPSASEYDLAVLPKDKATPVVFYCANEKCTASHTAAKRALGAGYNDVAVLSAGISGWVKAGKPVTKPVG